MNRTRSALALVLALGLSACATGQSADSPSFSGAPPEDQIRVEVQNFNFQDATIWAIVQSGRRIRLGMVTGKTDSVFTLDWDFSLPLRMEIDLVAGGRCMTERLDVDPGDILLLQIEPVLRDTSGCR